MTTLNDFSVADLTIDVLAIYYNKLLGSVFRKEFSNAVTMSTDLTLTDGDTPIQRLDCNGANRVVKMAVGAAGNHPQLLINTTSSGAWTLTAKSNDGTTVLKVLNPGEIGYFLPDGSGLYVEVGAGVEGHVIKGDGVSLPQSASIDFVGGGVDVTNEAGGTQINIRSTTNLVLNGGFDFAQRQDPAALTTIAQDGYSADRWRVSRENDGLQYQRADGLAESGLTSQYFGTYKKTTNSGKFMVYQIIEGVNSIPMRGKSMILQLKLKTSSAKTIRVAVIELQNAGTIDVIPSTFVTAWGGSGVDPTLGANLAIITAESKSVTTTMQSFSVLVDVPSNSKNIIVAVWSDSQFAVDDMISVGEVRFDFGKSLSAWYPRFAQSELALCQRYFRRLLATGRFYSPAIAANQQFPQAVPVTMRTSPTIIAGASIATANVSASTINTALPDTLGYSLTASAVGDTYRLEYFDADAEL